MKDPSVLRQAVPGSQSSSLLSHSSKSGRHSGNKQNSQGLTGTLLAVYRQPRGKHTPENVKNHQSDQFWAVLQTGVGWGQCQQAAGAVLEESLVPG